jgi:hypothetical protein
MFSASAMLHIHRFITVRLLLVGWGDAHSGSLAASNIHVLGGHQFTAAWAVLCKLWRWDFEPRGLKYMVRSLHFVWYIHKENFAIWAASITSKGICYTNSIQSQIAVRRYLTATFGLPVTNQTTVWVMYLAMTLLPERSELLVLWNSVLQAINFLSIPDRRKLLLLTLSVGRVQCLCLFCRINFGLWRRTLISAKVNNSWSFTSGPFVQLHKV